MKPSTGWLFVGLLASCGSDPTLDVSKVVTGLYKFTATTQTDNCTPTRFAGQRTAVVGVFVGPGGLSLSDANADGEARYELKSADGYSNRTPKEGDRIYPCPEVRSGSYAVERTLLSAAPGRVEVDDIEDWEIPSTCTSVQGGVPGVPTSSCHSERLFVYELQKECQSPCTIKQETTPGLSQPYCDCPGS